MESSFLTSVFLPLTLFLMILGMGLGLTVDDFKRVFVQPKGAIVGLIAQLIVIPLVGFILANTFPLSPELAVGLMILTACPGGPTSNIITYLVKGNVALSVTLTAVSSLITIVTIPLIVNFSMERFMDRGVELELPFLNTVLQIAVITIIPISIGMLIRYYRLKFAMTLERYVKIISVFLLAVIFFGVLFKERDIVVGSVLQVGAVIITLNLLTMALGYGLATLSKLDRYSSKSITVEVGIQNAALAMTIASAPTLLNMPIMAIPGAVYSLIMYITSGVLVGIIGDRWR